MENCNQLKIVIRVYILAGLGLLIPGISLGSDLIPVQWLYPRLDDSSLVIVDLRKAEDYVKGHIPNAINLPFSTFTREKNGVQGYVETPGTVNQVLSAAGIRNEDTIVLYSDWSFIESMRVYWILDFYGHSKTLILDGGIQAWEKQGKKLSVNNIILPPSNFIVEINPDVITTKVRTFMATKSQDYYILDARDGEQYSGEKSLTNRKGHIPNAKNIPWFDLIKNREAINNFDRIETPSILDEPKVLMDKLSNIPRDKKIILYCNGGQESSVIYFALKQIGVKSSLYDGSWFEWSADKKMPVEVGMDSKNDL